MSDFPDVRWGSDTSRLKGPLIAFSITRLGSWLIKTATPLDRKVLIRSRGRFTVLGPIGAPLLLLTTTGKKSGLPRTTPLLYARDGESLVVAGSNFGQAHHPAWTGNLMQAPRATVTLAGKDIPVHTEHLSGQEAERAYQLMVDLTRTYDAYRSRTDREIRVFRLTAVRGSVDPA